MISEHRRFGGGLFGPRLWGTSCRSACRSEIGRENEQCFDPAWSSVCLCGPIHQKTMAKNWRTNHTLWLYPMVFVVGGRLWQKIIVWGILFWDKTILWMLLKLRDVILSSNSFEIISVFNQQPRGKKATPISRSTDIPSWSCFEGHLDLDDSGKTFLHFYKLDQVCRVGLKHLSE